MLNIPNYTHLQINLFHCLLFVEQMFKLPFNICYVNRFQGPAFDVII